MVDESELKSRIQSLLSEYNKLSNKQGEAEKRTEDFIKDLFEALGWNFLSNEVIPQKKVKSAIRTTRVDYSFKKSGDVRPSFYLEAKRFSDNLENPDHRNQALSYGKNSGIRWVILTNFIRWRVFNSDYFDKPEDAELFEFNLNKCLSNEDDLRSLILFSRENGGHALDEYAKKHKKWEESADIEELLTRRLLIARKSLGKAIKEQNLPKFDTGQDMEKEIDACVQHILDRIIFCRMLEDNGGDPDRKLKDVLEKWENGDRRIQFYRDCLCPFFSKMHDKYNSTIFDQDRIDRLAIKNEDFIPVLKSFYKDAETALFYRFDAIKTDVLGHAYENYLSWKVIAKKKGLEEEQYKRKQGGIYYTPEFLVDYLVCSTVGELLKKCKKPEDVLKIRVLDPACGSGTFLVRAFDEFKNWFEKYGSKTQNLSSASQTKLDFNSEKATSNFLDSVLENCLYGIDIDHRAARLARLNLFLRAIDTPKQLPNLNIIERNSLIWDLDHRRAANGGEPFIFERDFPLGFESGGFDIVLANPPWEKWKFDSQEFFEPYCEGFKSLPAQEAKKKAVELLRKPLIKRNWIEKNAEYEYYSSVYRENYKFQSAEVNGKMVSGDLDLYKVFTERFHQLLKDGGLAGIVIPSGIYTDLGAKGLRTMLFDHSKIRALYSFENRSKAIFPDVHASYKPILLVFEKGGQTKSFPCAFFLHTPEDLQKAIENPTVLDVDFIKKSSPTSWGILEIKSPKDYEITKKLLVHPPLGQKIEGVWNIEMQSGFHMTSDSHLFKNAFMSNGIPMLEGKNVHQFTHRWKEAPTPRYKILEKDVEANLKPDKIYHKNYWMAYRLIASSTNYRTFISTIVPPGYVCGNSIAIIRLPNLKQLCFLNGIMNSFVIDYLIRQKVSANINMFYFLETPVPRLSSSKEFEEIVRKVAQLVCATDEFKELKKEVGLDHGLTNENDRALARAQLDAMIAKLYNITKEELAFILEKFPIADQKQKDLVLRC